MIRIQEGSLTSDSLRKQNLALKKEKVATARPGSYARVTYMPPDLGVAGLWLPFFHGDFLPHTDDAFGKSRQ